MIVIIGAGPIGLEMAIELSRTGAPFRILDAGNFASTIEWYAPGTEIFSSPERLAIAGVPFEPISRKASREDYLLYLRTVVRQFAIPVESYKRVIAIKKNLEDEFNVIVVPSSHGVGGALDTIEFNGNNLERETIAAKTIVFAIGNLHLPQTLGVKGEDQPWVSHYMSEPHRYAGTRVTIVGSGNSAAEAAIRLYHVGATVTLCQRKEGFRPKRIKPWLLPELEGLIKEGKIKSFTNFQVTEIESKQLRGAQKSAKEISIASDFVLLLTGYKQRRELFDELDIKMQNAQPVYDSNTMQTSVPGVFVIGTAAAGTETTGVTTFIENAHVHVKRVLHALRLGPAEQNMPDRPVEEREI